MRSEGGRGGCNPDDGTSFLLKSKATKPDDAGHIQKTIKVE